MVKTGLSLSQRFLTVKYAYYTAFTRDSDCGGLFLLSWRGFTCIVVQIKERMTMIMTMKAYAVYLSPRLE